MELQPRGVSVGRRFQILRRDTPPQLHGGPVAARSWIHTGWKGVEWSEVGRGCCWHTHVTDPSWPPAAIKMSRIRSSEDQSEHRARSRSRNRLAWLRFTRTRRPSSRSAEAARKQSPRIQGNGHPPTPKNRARDCSLHPHHAIGWVFALLLKQYCVCSLIEPLRPLGVLTRCLHGSDPVTLRLYNRLKYIVFKSIFLVRLTDGVSE